MNQNELDKYIVKVLSMVTIIDNPFEEGKKLTVSVLDACDLKMLFEAKKGKKKAIELLVSRYALTIERIKSIASLGEFKTAIGY